MSRPTRAIIVDDERLARRKLRTLLEEEGVDVLAECGNGRDAVAQIRRTRPELLFLDVELPDFDGFEVLHHAGREHLRWVIFVTAYDHYAVQAFGVDAVDYLLKPFDRERLREALTRVRGRSGEVDPEAILELLRRVKGDQPLRRISVKEGGRVRLVDTERVRWFEAADNYVTLHAVGEEYLVRDTLSRLESQLDPSRFLRVHRRAIVNMDVVTEVRTAADGDHELLLDDRSVVPVGRRYRAQLLSRVR